MTYNPKPPKRIKTRKPLRRIGRVGRGNDAFSQSVLAAWFSSGVIEGRCMERTLNGLPVSVSIVTVDGHGAIVRFDPKTDRYMGVNVVVGHIDDKCLRPDLRWDPKNVAPITPALNQSMKYFHSVRAEAKAMMTAWVAKRFAGR